jgi:SAM-dependent methyltransferase
MFDAFIKTSEPTADDTILDVGATSDRSYSHSNYLEAWYPHKHNVTAVGIDDARFLRDVYPGVRFVLADGRDLPFADRAFDHVHSSAVLEHVGSRASQTQFLRELWRVARCSLFVTTPNRAFPIEFHTVLPLVHWLPPDYFRAFLRRTGRGFFADEANLNLMTHGDLRAAAAAAGITGALLKSVALIGWPSNLLLVAQKTQRDQVV